MSPRNGHPEDPWHSQSLAESALKKYRQSHHRDKCPHAEARAIGEARSLWSEIGKVHS